MTVSRRTLDRWERFEQINRGARSITEAERAAQSAKTAKLRAMRLASDAPAVEAASGRDSSGRSALRQGAK